MISIEKLKRVSIVYVHAHCPDGLASAMILQDAFRMLGMAPRIEFLAHGMPEHQLAGIGEVALFCDIAPHIASQLQSADPMLDTIVLDHHVGAREIVESFGENGVYADAEKEPGVSWAVLAFREVWESVWNGGPPNDHAVVGVVCGPYHRVRDFAECVGARDTWQTASPLFECGQWISQMLMSRPASFWLNNDPRLTRPHPPYMTSDEMVVGQSLFDVHAEAVRQVVEQCVFFDVNGHGLAVFQERTSGFRLCSDVAETFRIKNTLLDVDFVAGFSYVVDKPGAPPRLLYSLRGLNGFDVCAFAKANGGGGHKAAAGFSMAIRNTPLGGGIVMTDPYEEVRRRLETFLISGGGTSS